VSLHFGTVNNQGRVVLPVEVRRALDLQAGDRLEFVIEADVVHLITPRMRAEALWAKNGGADDGVGGARDRAGDLRAARAAEQAAAAARWERIDAAVVESGSKPELEIADQVLAALGLTP
jgi:AbrB family looped-hinge helix DNA binding protein